jgi:DNA-directed RNA polymerase sigma subunit (sigma70/sigma32)
MQTSQQILQELQVAINEAVKVSTEGIQGLDTAIINKISAQLGRNLNEAVSLSSLKAKLAILFEYEKNYLELVKTHKEEIKFASSIQEDLRKERAKFFSDTLQEVSSTLAESQVDKEVASLWLQELVNSYTKSLDLSSGLIEEQTLDTIGKIREEAKREKSNINVPNGSGNSV